MTTNPSIEDLLPIAHDITAALSATDRSERLVQAVVRALPCDAAVLLRLDGAVLVPIAAHGLSPDAMGRRFARKDHPRLEVICNQTKPTVFPADSPLPDPFDGLVVGAPHLDVHACLGCPLRIEDELVGVLAVDSLNVGAFDKLSQPFLIHLAALAAAAMRTSVLIEALEQRAHNERLVASDLSRELHEQRGGELVGTSSVMVQLRRNLDLIARSDFPVLVTGETGVGKELVVRALHAQSARSARSLVYVNCAALPTSIVESELFGYAKGAFTGAENTRPGKFRLADGASLLLDEVGELPLEVQPKFLRVLQEGEIQPVGTDETGHVDVRIFAATNRDLEQEAKAGRFRSDLLHRLDVCRVHVPPLREHKEDIMLLAGHFADRARRRLGTGPIRFSPDSHGKLMQHDWPGNVRELENVVSRAILWAGGRVQPGDRVLVTHNDLVVGPSDPSRSTPSVVLVETPRNLRDSVNAFQCELIQSALQNSKGNWAAAARSLGMHRSNLFHLAKRLGLRAD